MNQNQILTKEAEELFTLKELILSKLKELDTLSKL